MYLSFGHRFAPVPLLNSLVLPTPPAHTQLSPYASCHDIKGTSGVLLFAIQLLKAGQGGGFGPIEGIFLPPNDDFGRADFLNDPMAHDCAGTGIQQNIRNVFTNGQARI